MRFYMNAIPLPSRIHSLRDRGSDIYVLSILGVLRKVVFDRPVMRSNILC
jgi:hypothetical protein